MKKQRSQTGFFFFFFFFFLVFFIARMSAEAQGLASTQVMPIELKEWEIVIGKTQLMPGKVTFRAKNKGHLAHEMVVIKTSIPAQNFEVEAGKVKEEAVGILMGEIEGFSSGKSEELTLVLSEGTYVLFCNNLEKGQLKGHYERGMSVSFSVTPSS